MKILFVNGNILPFTDYSWRYLSPMASPDVQARFLAVAAQRGAPHLFLQPCSRVVILQAQQQMKCAGPQVDVTAIHPERMPEATNLSPLSGCEPGFMHEPVVALC